MLSSRARQGTPHRSDTYSTCVPLHRAAPKFLDSRNPTFTRTSADSHETFVLHLRKADDNKAAAAKGRAVFEAGRNSAGSADCQSHHVVFWLTTTETKHHQHDFRYLSLSQVKPRFYVLGGRFFNVLVLPFTSPKFSISN